MGTQRACTNTKHIELERWGPPPVDADWHASCQTIHKGIEGDECCFFFKKKDFLKLGLGWRGLWFLLWRMCLFLLSSVVTEFCVAVSGDSDWKFVEPQSSSFSRMRSFVWAGSQEEMRYEGSPVKSASVPE